MEARDPAATVGIPGGGGGRVVLKVPRREREAAERAAALLTAGLDREGAEGPGGGTGRGGSR